MAATRANRLTATCILLALASTAARGEAAPGETTPPPERATASSPESKPDRVVKHKIPEGFTADPALARAEVAGRLKRTAGAGERDSKGLPAGSKALQEVLQDRLKWIDDWEKAVKARHDAEHPEPSPERQTADLNADLERVKATIAQSAKAPETVLPASFRSHPAHVSDALRSEMKEAIDDAQGECKEWAAKLEKSRAEPGQADAGRLTALRAERDKIHQRIVTLKTRRAERETALTTAKTVDAREIARERLINFEWESRVEHELLQGHEARMALEAKLADLATLKAQVYDAHIRCIKKSLETMQTRYKATAEREELALKQAAVSEQDRAAKSHDPLESYRARRRGELLELKALVIKDEKARDTNAPPSVEDQKALADAAEYDFAGVKRLLDDGKVSHLDALRLNNDFRRIGPERERIVKTDLATASNRLVYYENALSGVELSLLNDSREDRTELENLLERLPEGRHAEALALADDLEAKHGALLRQHRKVLGELASKAEQTHEQILRRLRILDDQYGFIRTHIFWVRDQEAVGAGMLRQSRREASLLGKGLFKLGLDACNPKLWGRISAEFLLGAVAALALPWFVFRAQRWLAPPSLDSRRAPALVAK